MLQLPISIEPIATERAIDDLSRRSLPPRHLSSGPAINLRQAEKSDESNGLRREYWPNYSLKLEKIFYSGEDLKVRVAFSCSESSKKDLLGILPNCQEPELTNIPLKQALGIIQRTHDMSLADFQDLHGRLESIRAFSGFYQDVDSERNVARTQIRLFRAAALSNDVGEFLKRSILGKVSIRQVDVAEWRSLVSVFCEA